jgi:hypothetical protein
MSIPSLSAGLQAVAATLFESDTVSLRQRACVAGGEVPSTADDLDEEGFPEALVGAWVMSMRKKMLIDMIQGADEEVTGVPRLEIPEW